MPRFMLNVGRHVQDHPTLKVREGGLEWPAERVYVRGEVIETEEDLERFNSPGAGGPKFTKLDDPKEEDTIESLEAKLALLRAKQAEASIKKPTQGIGMTEDEIAAVSEAAKKGFQEATSPQPDHVVPQMPKPNPGNVAPLASSQEAGSSSTGRGTISDGVRMNIAKLQAMSLKQLQDLAAEEEVDIKGSTSKDAIIRMLRKG